MSRKALGTLGLEPRGMVAMMRYLEESIRSMCEYDDEFLGDTGFNFFTDPL